MQAHISVRPADSSDCENIIDYFLTADKDFLAGMGVDCNKLPGKQDWLQIINSNLLLSVEQKQFFYVIWQIDGKAGGHSNINKIVYGKEAYMHLHIWQKNTRQQGAGLELMKLTLPFYFNTFQLEHLYCEPAAFNPGPNKTLAKLGFEWQATYDTIPGWINFHQTVNRWAMTKEIFSNSHTD